MIVHKCVIARCRPILVQKAKNDDFAVFVLVAYLSARRGRRAPVTALRLAAGAVLIKVPSRRDVGFVCDAACRMHALSVTPHKRSAVWGVVVHSLSACQRHAPSNRA